MVRAIDAPNDLGGIIEISWTLSIDDRPAFHGIGGATVLGAGGPITVYRGHGIDAYRIYRRLQREEDHLIAEVAAGKSHHLDTTVF
jgi:hypothetical protein